MKRREFLKSTVAAASVAAGGLVPHVRAAQSDCGPGCSCYDNAAKLPRRAYGDTGERLSIIGFGGMVVSGAEQDYANRVVAEAVEKGVNYFDVAPSYGDAEIKLGPALEPYRKDVFLACKTEHRTKERDGGGVAGIAAAAADGLPRSLSASRYHRRSKGC